MVPDFEKLATDLGTLLQKKEIKIVTAESCTGGGVAQVLTSVAGSSRWFDRGFVTYSNESKRELLGVKRETLEQFGAVSEETVQEMAKGALSQSHAQISLAVTGIAGPGGGSDMKPVGTVWFAWSVHGGSTRTNCSHFTGGRQVIRVQAIEFLLKGLLQEL